MKFSISDFFSKCDQQSFLRLWSHLLKKSLMENFLFRAVYEIPKSTEFYLVYIFRYKEQNTGWQEQVPLYNFLFNSYAGS